MWKKTFYIDSFVSKIKMMNVADGRSSIKQKNTIWTQEILSKSQHYHEKYHENALSWTFSW